MIKKCIIKDAKYQLQAIKNYNGVDGVKFNEKTFKKIEKALKLASLYKEIHSLNEEINDMQILDDDDYRRVDFIIKRLRKISKEIKELEDEN